MGLFHVSENGQVLRNNEVENSEEAQGALSPPSDGGVDFGPAPPPLVSSRPVFSKLPLNTLVYLFNMEIGV